MEGQPYGAGFFCAGQHKEDIAFKTDPAFGMITMGFGWRDRYC